MNYYYANEGNQAVGPYTAEGMRQLYAQGTLDGNSWVIMEGVAEWKTYATVFLTGTEGGRAVDGTTRCSRCGAENEGDARFCEACGSAMSGAVPEARPRSGERSRRGRWVLAGVVGAVLMLLAAAWAVSTWRPEWLSGHVADVAPTAESEPVPAKLASAAASPGSGPSGAMAEAQRRDRHAALLVKASRAVAARQWAAAVTAYEAALVLFDDEETRAGLAEAVKARDLERDSARQPQDGGLGTATAGQAEPAGGRPAAPSARARAASVGPTEPGQERARLDAATAAAPSPAQPGTPVDEAHAPAPATAPDETGPGAARTLQEQKVAAFDELMQRGLAAEGRKDWSMARAIYIEALAAAPDAAMAALVRARGSRVMAVIANEAILKTPVSQAVTLGLSSRKILGPSYLGSAQLHDDAGRVVGTVSLTPDNTDWINAATLVFKGRETATIGEFSSNDSVGATKSADAEGLSLAGRVTSMTTGRNGSRGAFIRTMTVTVTATRPETRP